MGNGKSQKKENVSKQSNKNTVRKNNESIHSIKSPSQFMTEEEFFKTWPPWQKQFLAFKKQLSVTNSDVQQWGNMLLNLVGPVGQIIHNSFTFDSINETENVDVLLEKFDEYWLFAGKKKLPLENVYEYIRELQLIVKEKNVKNEDKVLRKKILTEIEKQKFIVAAKYIIPTFEFSTDFNKLTIKEIAFIWAFNNDNLEKTACCIRCGGHHASAKCPALGKQCSKCNDLNHFSRRCPTIFIHNCNYCGGAHIHKNCPSFGEVCTKCQKLNHFSWKCQQQILQCQFCGLTHAASRSVCPTRYIVCNNCKTVGHIASKCNRRFRTRN